MSEGVPVGAIPFCWVHEQDWQEGCDGCDGGRLVMDGLADHRTRFPDCQTWPICDCTSRSLEAWIGADHLELPGDEA